MAYLLALTFLLTPTYVIRFTFLHVPTNLLMVWVFWLWILFFGGLLVQKRVQEFIQFIRDFDKKIIILTGLFFLAGLISLFVNGIDQKKVGEFIVLFFQPIITFFITAYIVRKSPVNYKLLLVNCCYALLGLAGLYAIIQYHTLWGLPPAWWGNSIEPKRAVSFFGHPDFYGLFSAPLLAFLIPDALTRLKLLFSKSKINYINLVAILGYSAGVFGLILSQSRAGWIGLATAFVAYIIFAGDKKTKLLAGGLIILAILFVSFTNFRYRILVPLLTHEKSSYSRIALWESGWKGIQESPIFGLGLTGYSNQYKSLISDPSLDAHNFPHNIFLDTWVETGLMGLIGLISLIGLMLYRGLIHRTDITKLAVSLFLIALLVQGQFDNPYFKNDLALVFWIILALSI